MYVFQYAPEIVSIASSKEMYMNWILYVATRKLNTYIACSRRKISYYNNALCDRFGLLSNLFILVLR